MNHVENKLNNPSRSSFIHSKILSGKSRWSTIDEMIWVLYTVHFQVALHKVWSVRARQNHSHDCSWPTRSPKEVNDEMIYCRDVPLAIPLVYYQESSPQWLKIYKNRKVIKYIILYSKTFLSKHVALCSSHTWLGQNMYKSVHRQGCESLRLPIWVHYREQ